MTLLLCFVGSAGYRLHVPPAGFVLDPHLQEEPQEGQREARAEVQIARKLQCIADQFHRLHIQRVGCLWRGKWALPVQECYLKTGSSHQLSELSSKTADCQQ